ncbi:hypothetical protein JD844_003495 [Phrynosoma platyrhinos]|uniref:Protein-tyrosine phosphatase receptor IA-2 ectodomain domain-containing protein n=1 Tax=Phrynosoma platyrhinos TaxID=52577 RepID=A0ABQ7TCW2_PHRPL|nr:hypothetical protein JD844_003495 [Phrynosoma platyrhinos]
MLSFNSPLTEEKGLELIREVAVLLKLQMTAFADIKYTYVRASPIIYNSMLGPAVTFKVHSNALNVTTADVAKAAGKNPY